MKSVVLFLCFIECSYCLQMIKVSRNSETVLPTQGSEDKYFYLTNSDYFLYSYIYISLEDNNFGLSYNSIKYCSTNKDPNFYPYTTVSGCTFTTLSLYRTSQTSSGATKYYYQIYKSSSYSYYVVKYEGKNSLGNLYVTSDYNDFIQTLSMEKVNINSRKSLSTTSTDDKYFYLTNIDYYSHSSYIYICLEDNNFGLKENKIKYCRTSTNPSSPSQAVKSCIFNSIPPYSSKSSSNTTKYYYKIGATSYYSYSIFYYEGIYSSGNLYVTTDYNDLVKAVKMIQVNINSRTFLSTSSLEDKYFYLRNSNYYLYSSYIYFCLEDYNFDLSYNNIKYCRTNINPDANPDNATNDCSFNLISPYSRRSSSSGTTKYYYKIATTSYYTYSIVSYEGISSLGNLYVTYDYNDLVKAIRMTKVNKNSKTSLPTISSEDKYFFLTNKDYYSYSYYIYICLEDNNFGLSNNNIKYCQTNINPDTNPENAVNNCSFSTKYYYDNTKSSSGTTKYYYKIPTSSSYSYSIINYEGSYSSGYLYVTSDYNDLVKTVKMTKVYRNSRTYLQTSSSYDKYFFLTNSNYYSNSYYIYICLEDNNFGLNYNNIKYCLTNEDPSSNPDSAVSG